EGDDWIENWASPFGDFFEILSARLDEASVYELKFPVEKIIPRGTPRRREIVAAILDFQGDFEDLFEAVAPTAYISREHWGVSRREEAVSGRLHRFRKGISGPRLTYFSNSRRP